MNRPMTALIGMKEICKYCQRSEPTILMLIRTQAFPADKFSGVWESDTELIDDWRREKIRNAMKKKRVKQKDQKK